MARVNVVFCTLNDLMYVNHRTAEVENECFMAICPESDLWKFFLLFYSFPCKWPFYCLTWWGMCFKCWAVLDPPYIHLLVNKSNEPDMMFHFQHAHDVNHFFFFVQMVILLTEWILKIKNSVIIDNLLYLVPFLFS